MKISKLLVLSALWLVSLGASAADLIERVQPTAPDWAPKFGDAITLDDNVVQTAAEFQVGKFYVLYNKGKELYFSQGCSWSTQAALDVTPIVVRFTLPDGKSLSDNALLLTDYNIYTNSWKECFFDSETAMFTDRGTQDNYYWNVIAQGDNTYRLQASPLNKTFNPTNNSGFVGFDVATAQGGDTHGRGVGADAWALSPFLAEGDGHYIDWSFYEVTGMEDWTAYFNDVDIYNKSGELKALIEEAEAENVDATAAVEMYNNADATLEEIKAAIEALQETLKNSYDKILEPATAENPVNAGFYIKNPNFDNASNADWDGTKPNMVGSGSHGPANVAEQYNKTYDTYQNLGTIRPGIYQLKNSAFYRGSWDDYKNDTNRISYLYAAIGQDTLTVAVANPWEALNTESMAGATEFGTTAAESSHGEYYTPNDPSAARLYFEKGFYKNQVFFQVNEGEAPSIGMVKRTTISGDWTCFDNFDLVYYGPATPEAFKVWLNNSQRSFDGIICTTSYLEAYQACFGSEVTDKASVLAAIESAKEPLAELKKNIDAWERYQAICKEAKAVVIELDGEPVIEDLADYLTFDYEENLEALKLTTEELEAEILSVGEMVKACNSAIKTDTDITTRFLKNADFTNGDESWIKGKDSRPGLAFREKIAEAYDTDFDLYQVTENMPKGVYEVQLQGFFRMARDNDAYTKYTNDQQITEAGVYINNNKTLLHCVYDFALEDADERAAEKGSGWWQNTNNNSEWYPNDMTSAAKAFSYVDENEQPWYLNKAFGLVVEDGATLKIGIGGNVKGANWICFDNLKLFYRGYSAETIQPVLVEALDKLPSTDEMMTKTTYEKFDAAVQAANAAIESADGKAMFDALVAIYALGDEVNASVAICQEVDAAAEDLSAEIGAALNPDFESEAYALVETIQNGLRQKSYEDSDIEGLKIQLKQMRTKLMLDPNYASATIESPVDVTKVIVTPEFENEGVNSVKGWNAEGYNFGNDDTQKAAFALEFYNKTFDINQTIYGLPAGFYLVEASAFCRVGSIDQDYNAWKAKPDSTEAYLYAVAGEQIDSIATSCLFKNALDWDPGVSGQGSKVVDDVTYYFPNDMVSAFSFFGSDMYNNALLFEVKADDIVTIGIRKSVNTDTGWVLMDNFRLSYLGTDSSVTTDMKSLTEKTAQPLFVEFYTIDGRRVNAAQKGITIQKITKADGTVVVKKVRR